MIIGSADGKSEAATAWLGRFSSTAKCLPVVSLARRMAPLAFFDSIVDWKYSSNEGMVDDLSLDWIGASLGKQNMQRVAEVRYKARMRNEKGQAVQGLISASRHVWCQADRQWSSIKWVIGCVGTCSAMTHYPGVSDD